MKKTHLLKTTIFFTAVFFLSIVILSFDNSTKEEKHKPNVVGMFINK